MRRKRNLKRCNGSGCPVFLGKNRRYPYAARITVGFDKNGKQKYEYIGYAETYDEADWMLKSYYKSPYDIDVSKMTVEEVFEKLQPKLLKELEECKNKKKKGMSESNYKNLLNGFSNWKEIHKYKMVDLKKIKLQEIIDNSGLGSTSQGYMKNIISRLFSYYIDYLEGPIDKSPTIGLEIASKEKSDKFIPFTTEEINLIWKNKEKFYIKILLMMLYSGMRPKEICELEIKKTFLNEHYSIGGCKTEAGKDRIIPHHNKVQWIYKEFYNSNNKYLLNNPNTNNKFTKDNLSKNIIKELKEIGINNHYPYDARHTFATYLKLCGVSESDRKWLMGHSQKGDVTNDVYTHIDYKYLLDQVNKLKYLD